MKRFICASASIGRENILNSAGVKFEMIPAKNVNEKSIIEQCKNNKKSVSEISLELAKAKANSVVDSLWVNNNIFPKNKSFFQSNNNENICVVLGCDTIAYANNLILGKPANSQEAIENLRSYKSVRVYTGHYLIILSEQQKKQPNQFNRTLGSKNEISIKQLGKASVTKIKFAKMKNWEINKYINSGESLNAAGGFCAELKGSAFIKSIKGNFYNVVGLNMCLLNKMLKKLDCSIVDFWK